MKRISLPRHVRRTGAQYEDIGIFAKNADVVDASHGDVEAAGVPMAQIDDTLFATSKGEYHCFVIGDSGCGKTRRVILPSIRLMAKAGESMVIADPKGELYRTTAESLRSKGYTVYVLNFRNPSRGHCWNPLGQIERLYHTGGQEDRDKALMLLGDIADVLKEGIGGDNVKDPYWSLCAANVFRGVALLILENSDLGHLTFENIAITARLLGENLREENGRSFGTSPEKTAIQKYLKDLPKGSPVANNLSVIVTNANSTRDCILSEFESMISLYSSQELLIDLFSRDEIDISSLGKQPTALFFILPDDSAALYPIATVFVKEIYSTLVSLADEQPDGKLPNRVTFLLDEFANFARLPSVDSMLTAARSRRIRFVLVCQSMDQLTDKYQESGRETLLANCRVWIYMSCRNLPFLRRLQDLIGDYCSPYTGESYPLIDIGDLQHFEMGQVLVLNDRCRPLIGFLPDYDKYQFGEGSEVRLALLPEPREKVQRSRFDLMAIIQNPMKKTTTTKTPVNAPKPSRPSDGLRAVIEGMMAEAAQPAATGEGTAASTAPASSSGAASTTQPENVTTAPPVTQPEKPTGDVAHFAFMMEQFERDQYGKAAQYTIDHLGEPGLTHHNLAFLLRFGKVNTSKLSAPFALDVEELLQDELKNNEASARLNLSLLRLDQNALEQAKKMLEDFTAEDWNEVFSFWHKHLWVGKQHPEGALVCMLAVRKNADLLPDAPLDEMKKVAKQQYKDIMVAMGLLTEEEAQMEDAAESENPSSTDVLAGFSLEELLENMRLQIEDDDDGIMTQFAEDQSAEDDDDDDDDET